MLTVIETPTFSRLAADYWTEDERGAFAAFIASHPEAGNVVPGSGGLRKVRWSRQGTGKRGGVRVIYYNRLANGEIWLLLIYAKSARENIPTHILRAIKAEVDNA
ncbi:MAG: type II toxin-antitoxin system RelE/ParE family toxin [Gallionella sp.]|nr:type II toxin-antitoxin system RelE/ParE family toxin [Gallionella sp.]